MDSLLQPERWIPVVVLVVLWLLEGAIPFYHQFRRGMTDRLRHDGGNIALGIINKVILVLSFAFVYEVATTWADEAHFGLLHLAAVPTWLAAAIAFLALDLWTYLWHRANHVVPFLWRFHRVHHSDAEMDATSAVRFHTGEVVISAIIRLGVIMLVGMSLWHVALYDAVFLPLVVFHHSNIRLPRWLDYGLSTVIVTPAMHRVHHSRWRPQTNSNYSSVLSWWDMIFRTFRLRRDAHAIELGLHGFDDARHQSLLGLLRTPIDPIEQDPRGSIAKRDSDGSH